MLLAIGEAKQKLVSENSGGLFRWKIPEHVKE